MPHRTIVTGGSSGVGAAIARDAAADGHDVTVVSRRPGGVGRHLSIDLSTRDGWDQLAESLADLADGASVLELFHAAGTITPIGFAGEVDPAEYRANVLLNAAAPLVIGEAFLRVAAGVGCPATLVFLTSGAARTPYPGWSAYCAGKAAVDQWTRTAGAEQASRGGVKVVAIAPGVVDTPMQAEVRTTDASDFPKLDRFQGLYESGDLADPDDVARRLRAAVPSLENGAVVDLRNL